MQIRVELTAARIEELADLRSRAGGNVGAWVEFRGLVRAEEAGQQIAALEYEAYAAMAEAEMRRILLDLGARHPCQSAVVVHRTGVVPAGEMAIHIGVAARHRAEAFALLTSFLERLKADVPIWKTRAVPAGEVAIPGAMEAPPSGAIASDESPRTPAEVIAILQTLCTPLQAERVQLSDAAGRVLREPVRAEEDQPAFDRSSVDGYAVRLDDPSSSFRIVDEVRAGDWKPRALLPGETVRIATGGALPAEGLQVLMREDVRVDGGTAHVLSRSQARNIRFKSEDARAGEVLIAPGTVLEPGTLGLLASVGCTNPMVTRLPRVVHVLTGNEIVPPEQKPGRGQIRDSNSTLVRAFFQRQRLTPNQLKAGEEEQELERALRDLRCRDCDLLLISGGASVGEHDFTRRILERCGWHVCVSKTTTRPGKPLIVARRDKAVAFGLPGNPLAHWVCLNLYVRVALDAFAGLSPSVSGPFEAGVMAEGLDTGANARETFWPARWTCEDGEVKLRPLPWRSSGDLTSLALANAIIRVQSGVIRLETGQQVEFVRA